MNTKLIAIFLCVFSFNNVSCVAYSRPKITVTEEDKALFKEKIAKYLKDSVLSTGELIFKIGTDFKGTPYMGKTLDLTIEENLVVNLHGLDCTTLVENCLAIARALKSGEATFERFVQELENIRYRNGKLNGYTSRLHYFTEWAIDNEAKKIVDDISSHIGGEPYKVNLNFMGTHPGSYPQLIGRPKLVEEIKQIEVQVSAKQFSFIPIEKIASCENLVLDGDLVAFVTKIPGLDVSHVGILFRKDGRIFLLHASQSVGKVDATKVPLAEFLKGSKSNIGIFVIRAK